MKNWKHTMSAILAVVMVGSLATIQVKEMSAVLANKNNEEISVNIPKEEIVNKANEIGETDSQKIKETADEMAELDNVEVTKPYEPKAGYVIATSSVLNVREERSTDSDIIAQLNPGCELWLTGEYEDWYMISVEIDGITEKGYVSKEFVTASYQEARDILLDEVMYEKSTVSAGMELKAYPDMNAMALEVFVNNEDVIIISQVDDTWSQIYTTDDYSVGYVLNAGLIPQNKMILREDVLSQRKETLKAVGAAGVVYGGGSNVTVKVMPMDEAEDKISLPKETSCLTIKTIGDWTMISYGDSYSIGYVKSTDIITKEAYDEIKAEEERVRKEEERKRQEEEKRRKEEQERKNKESSKSTPSQKTTTHPAPSNCSKGQQIVNTAAKYYGVRYVYGGTTPSGFDCSGLVQYVCREVGISVNRTSRDQFKNGVAVSYNDLQPGDLVFFAKGSSISHVGIYAGNGEVIHSPRPGKVVCRVPMSQITYSSKYVGARRVY